MSENGKWQIAFWLISSLCGVWLLTLTSGVVANDRLRATEDQRIEKLLADSIRDISKNMELMAGDMREIKTRLIFAEKPK